MELIAKLWGVELEDPVGGPGPFPEATLELRCGREEVNVRAAPRLSWDKGKNEPIVAIEVTVGWPAAGAYSVADAGVAACLHTVAVDRAMLAESVASGRRWAWAGEVKP